MLLLLLNTLESSSWTSRLLTIVGAAANMFNKYQVAHTHVPLFICAHGVNAYGKIVFGACNRVYLLVHSSGGLIEV